MKIIKLTKNLETIVDDDIFEKYGSLTWSAWCGGSKKYTYASTTINKKFVYLHRLIIETKNGLMIDHINRNTLDNRRENLRLSTNRQNQINSSKIRGKVPYKGVTIELSGKFRAKIRTSKGRLNLGLFLTAKEAALAYDLKAKEIYGEFAFQNFSTSNKG